MTIFVNNFQITGIQDLLAAVNDQITMVDTIYLGT